MNRRALIFVSAIWLVAASLQAPFAHVHPQETVHDATTGLAHLHLGHDLDDHHSSPAGMPVLDHADNDDDALWQDWTPAASARIAVVYTQVAVPYIWAPNLADIGRAPEFAPRGHDPPPRHQSSARAPPV